MKFQIVGKDFRSSKRLRLTLVAPDEAHARAAAEKRGLIIDTVAVLSEEAAHASAPHAAHAAHAATHETPTPQAYLPPVPDTPVPPAADEDLAALSVMSGGTTTMTTPLASPAAYAAPTSAPVVAPETRPEPSAHAHVPRPTPPAYRALSIVSMLLVVVGGLILCVGIFGSLIVLVLSFIAGAKAPAHGPAELPNPGFGALGVAFSLYLLALTVPPSLLFVGFGLGLRALRDIARNTYVSAHR